MQKVACTVECLISAERPIRAISCSRRSSSVFGISFLIAMVISFRFQGSQIFAKPIEVTAPLESTLIDPLLGDAERLGLHPARPNASDFFRAHQARFLEYREMLHHCRKRHLERPRQRAHRSGTVREL